MFVLTLISLLAIFLTILDSRHLLKGGLKYAFIIVTFFACIRYDYGNDYVSYKEDFELVDHYSLSYIIEYQEQLVNYDTAFKDIGWVIFCKIFHPFGFFILTALISLFQNYIYYQFIKENVRREYLWIAMFLYLFQFEYYVLPMSMIRQGLAIALFVWAWHFIKRKEIIIPIILSFFSILLHKSAIIFVPFIFLVRYFPFSKGKIMSISLLCLLVIMFTSAALVNSIFENMAEQVLFESYFNQYGQGISESKGMGVIRKVLTFVPFVLALNYIRHENVSSQSRALVFLSTIGVLIQPFSFIISLISRLCFYFNIYSIAAIPLSLHIIRNSIIRYSFMCVIMIVTLYQYYDFFHDPIYTTSFLEYKTIFNII